MSSQAKAKGTSVETGLVRFAVENGFPLAERIPLHGANDRGDVRLGLDPLIVAECKWAMRGIQPVPWLGELEREIVNHGAEIGVLVCKQRGVGNARIGSWVAITPAYSWNLSTLAAELIHGVGGYRPLAEVPVRGLNGPDGFAESELPSITEPGASVRTLKLVGGGSAVVSSLSDAIAMLKMLPESRTWRMG